MVGTDDAGPVLVLDHDRFFKELLTTFFVEFLELFFPQLAGPLERDSLEFLKQEVFANLLEGDAYRADIVVKARFKGVAAYFIIHVEHQSTAPRDFPRRFFRYFSLLSEEYGCPVYPIVVYSHDKPLKAEPSVYRVTFPDGEVLRFRFRVVQLNRLSWRKFARSANPVASALMAKMKIAVRDRPRVKLECLRLMLTLRLDPARLLLIGSFVDAYLRLNEGEQRVFERRLEEEKLKPEEKEAVMDYVTSWEQRGIEKGLERGLEQGLEQGLKQGLERGLEQGLEKGRIETLREMLLDVLATRFGAVEEPLQVRIIAMQSADELKSLAHRALTAGSLQELGLDRVLTS